MKMQIKIGLSIAGRFIVFIIWMMVFVSCQKEITDSIEHNSQTTSAQTVFQKTYGGSSRDRIEHITQTKDDGFIMAGSTSSFGTGSGTVFGNIYLVRTNSSGDTIWTKVINNTNGEEMYASSTQLTNDGGYIICGASGVFDPSLWLTTIFLMKTDSSGNPLWAKKYQSTLNGITLTNLAADVKQTSDGGYVVLGFSESFGINDGYLIKTDGIGNLLWSKNFGVSNTVYPNSIQVINNGFAIEGYLNIPNSHNWDPFLMKTDIDGNLIWAKTYDWKAAFEDMTCGGITSDGGFYMTGEICRPDSCNVYVMRTDGNGNLLWAKMYGGTGDDWAWSAIQANDGGFIIAGGTRSFGVAMEDVYMIRTDKNGNLLWTKTYGGSGSDNASSVFQTSDNGFMISANTSSFGAGNSDAYIIKTDDKGSTGGCNEANPATIVSTGAVVVSDFTLTTFSGTIVSNMPYALGKGGIVKKLCPR